MPNKVHPKIRREKAAQLLEQADQEQERRYKEIGKLFADNYLGAKSKKPPIDDLTQKADKILNAGTKKKPSPEDMRTTAAEIIKEAENDEAQRKQMLGEQILQLMENMPPGPGDQNLEKIKSMASRIWRQ